MPKQRSICLVPIPFSDLSSVKRRPVLIISNDDYNKTADDVMVIAITSNLRSKTYSTYISQEDMESGILIKNSLIRADKIYTISQSIILKTFGKIRSEKFTNAIEQLNNLIS